MYQIRTGYRTEWPNFTELGPIPSGVNILWIVWVIVCTPPRRFAEDADRSWHSHLDTPGLVCRRFVILEKTVQTRGGVPEMREKQGGRGVTQVFIRGDE
jgi:hypothetical protein